MGQITTDIIWRQLGLSVKLVLYKCEKPSSIELRVAYTPCSVGLHTCMYMQLSSSISVETFTIRTLLIVVIVACIAVRHFLLITTDS